MSVGLIADADWLRGAAEGSRAGDGAEDGSSVLLDGSFGGFDFSTVFAGWAAGVDSWRGAADGLRAGDGAVEFVRLTAAFDALRGAREGLRP